MSIYKLENYDIKSLCNVRDALCTLHEEGFFTPELFSLRDLINAELNLRDESNN